MIKSFRLCRSRSRPRYRYKINDPLPSRPTRTVRGGTTDQIYASIVSTLLALMDGVTARGQVVVIAATNRCLRGVGVEKV